MDEQRYKALQTSVNAGKATVAEKFLYDREKARREEPPNALERSPKNALGYGFSLLPENDAS